MSSVNGTDCCLYGDEMLHSLNTAELSTAGSKSSKTDVTINTAYHFMTCRWCCVLSLPVRTYIYCSRMWVSCSHMVCPSALGSTAGQLGDQSRHIRWDASHTAAVPYVTENGRRRSLMTLIWSNLVGPTHGNKHHRTLEVTSVTSGGFHPTNNLKVRLRR